MNKQKQTIDIELFFRGLSDRTRLRLINLMSLGEVCVCFLVEIIGPNQPKISRHLAYLRKVGIVSARREGKWMHYRLITPTDSYAADMLAQLRNWLATDAEMQRDLKQLNNICCAVKLPLHLQAAPKPIPLQKVSKQRSQ